MSYNERLILPKYLAIVGGRLYKDVKIGKRTQTSSPRWIDAVLIPGDGDDKQDLDWKTEAEDFAERIAGRNVEVLEAKRRLNRSVIGQVIVAEHLLKIEHETTETTPVVVCDEGDELLERVCKMMRVRVWIVGRGFVVC